MSSAASSPNLIPRHAGRLEVHLLGCVDFDSFLALQEQLIYEMSGRNDQGGVLLVCEHPPVVSLGREASIGDLLVESAELERLEIPLRWVSRGGGAYVHAPGQLAVYLYVPLDRLEIGVSSLRDRLERSAQAVCRELKIPAKLRRCEPGLWGRGGHLAYLGAGVRSQISCHGFFLNVAVEPWLLSLTSPNRVGLRATSIQAQRIGPISMAAVREAVCRHVADQFGYEETELSTGHPLLKRTRQAIPAAIR